MVARGLMLGEGGRYLSLAVPFGDYQPSADASARLHALFAREGIADRGGVRLELDRDEYRIDSVGRFAAGGRQVSTSSSGRGRWSRLGFQPIGTSELDVRRLG